MQFAPKPIFSFLICAASILLAGKASAQYPGMNKVYSDISRQNANQQTQMQMQMMENMNWRTGAGQGTIYQVTMKDSSVKKVVSYMYTDTILHKNFLLFVNKKFPKSDTAHRNQKIYSNETLYISTVINNASGEETFGVPTDSGWMFKVLSGPISVYAKSLDYLNTTVVMFVSDSEFAPSAIVGIQLNDGPIEKYTKENLIKMVGQDADALESIGKNKYYKAVKKFNRDAEKAAKK
jgi:hypothetical protein